MSVIVLFYTGEQPDHRGRYLKEIQSWDAGKLESVHDFIQWLFPLPERSPVNPSAPVLDSEAIQAFHERAELLDALLASFRTMIGFYGFDLLEADSPVIRPSRDVALAKWLTPGNHNLLRITRILRSTRLLGLGIFSIAFFDALAEIYATEDGQRKIGSVSFRFWRDAAAGSNADSVKS